MPVIECLDLTKMYGRRVMALKNVNLIIEAGQSFGLLGENGAGKSTLVRLLMGFIFPSSGAVRVLGETELARAHGRIGYVHERPIFETRFSGRSYLNYLCALSGLWDEARHERVEQLLTLVHLTEAAGRGVATYSKGMLQRLAIAQALLMEPELLILDEPTSGLDPRSQWEVRQLIGTLRQQGKTLLVCSHYLAEVEELCDAVCILRRGEVILQGAVKELVRSQGIVEIVLAAGLSASEVVARLGIEDLVIESQGSTLLIADKVQPALLAALVQAEVALLSLTPLSRTLEEVYVRTTQTSEQTEEMLVQRGRKA